MSRAVQLTRATAEHYPFALNLYLSAMRPYTEKLMAWDEAGQRDSFASQWKLDDIRIIVVDGKAIGWLQVAEMPAEIRLQQFFIAPDRQAAGIGTDVLNQMLLTWRTAGKPVVLTVLKNNPARRLYERLGFSVRREVDVKYEMELTP